MLYIADEREVAESPKVQGTNEERAYSFDFSEAGITTIASAQVAIYDWSDGSDVSATKLSSTAATAAGLVVTMAGKVQALTDGVEYRLVCRVTHDGNQESELYCRIFGRT